MMTEEVAAIAVNGVQKRYGKLTVLRDVTLEVAPGEIFTLLGANGAGKSTLIKLLTTLAQPDGGSIRVQGCDPVTQGGRVRRVIGLNAQAETLDDTVSGRANLRLVATLLGLADPQQAIAAVAKRLDLDAFLDRRVATYSGGMRRRLDLAMSLLGNPAVLFLDEPTTGVDPQNRLALWALIRELRDGGTTIFLTTQYLDEADALADRIAFMREGRIVKVGTPAQIKQAAVPTFALTVAAGQAEAAKAALAEHQLPYQLAGDVFTLAAAVAPQALAVLAPRLVVTGYVPNAVTLESVYLAVTKEAKHAHA
ncbi:ABC transporter ATP-binding protein [Lacticaseibacillus parakribbianus]|uniref:ABC transporter ATP-binding protein n=1 Tax=Lacticaseibacillus parakribbianus TaxID=2970927 RepID=UPI0021CB73D6|nr:ABC transporter ATP-binding protein [Lacticaseibacillus parakribbianus]